MKLFFANGVTGLIVRVFLPDSGSPVGAGKTGLAYNTANLIIATLADTEAAPVAYTAAANTIETIAALGTFAAPTSGKCRFKEIDVTNLPGLYEIQIADARWAVSNARAIIVAVQVDGVPVTYSEMQLSTPAGMIDVNVEQLDNDANALQAFKQSALAILRGTVAAGSSTTAINTTGLTPALTDVGQLIGRTIIFDRATATTGLRDQGSTITASTTGGAAVLTVAPALTSAPAAGDTFGVY